MTRHVMLDNVTHKDLRVIRDYARVPAYDVNVARVFPGEFIQLQMEYPLFFLRNKEAGDFEPIALLGFSDKENLYLDEHGWDAGYVPLSIERQPFLIGFQEKVVDGVPTQSPVVHIDMDHPSVGETEGERVFLPHGGESPLLEHISSVLMTINQGHEAAKSLSEMLVGLELVELLDTGLNPVRIVAAAPKECATTLLTGMPASPRSTPRRKSSKNRIFMVFPWF